MSDSEVPQSGLDWQLPAWMNTGLGWFVNALSFVIGSALVFGCIAGFAAISESLELLGILMALAILAAAIVIHEWGHVLAARTGGMTVACVQIGSLLFVPRRKGWRWRKTDSSWKWRGVTVAYPRTDVPLRPQYLRYVAGGPIANIIAGLSAICVGIALPYRLGAGLWFMFGSYNLMLAFLSLLPRTGRPIASDGLQLLRWFMGVDESDPRLALSRIFGKSLHGASTQDLPGEWIDALARQPAPMPLFHCWIVLKDRQERGEWMQAAAMLDPFIEAKTSLQADTAKVMADFLSTIRCEIDFSRAMTDEFLDHPLDQALTRGADWHYPPLRLRCQALQAARVGDLETMVAKLEQAVALARTSFDLSAEASEATLAASVRSMLCDAQHQSPVSTTTSNLALG